MGQIRVLIVADREAEAAALNRLLSAVAPDRELKQAVSAEEGLKVVAAQDFEIVFAHLSEGAAKATEFLNEVWKLRPTTVRFFLADSVNADLMISSALGAHHFLQAPVTQEVISAALARADAIYRFVRNERIQSLFSRMRTLPSRPTLYVDVMRELRSSSASAEAVGEIVSKDLAISTKLIQLVNSAFYALQQQVTDPGAAVLILGFETTASLVLSIEAMARFDKVKPLYFSMDRVWKHSQSIAQSAKRIAEYASNDREMARDAYTAGLLHDIGKLALALNFEEQYSGALKLAEAQKLNACDVERQVFGATHAEAGAYLLCLWGLPLTIVDAVANHHTPAAELPPQFTAATALHLAERLHGELENGPPKNGERAELEYPQELGIAHLLPAFRSIVKGEPAAPVTSEKSEPTKATGALKAIAIPVTAAAAPSPLIQVSTRFPGSRKTQVYAIAGALVALLSFGGFILLKGRGPIAVPVSKAASSAQPVEAAIAKASVPDVQPKSAPVVVSPLRQLASKLKLQAILYKGPQSSLIINGKNFRLGDDVDGARIVSIDQQAITLEKSGEQLLMSLNAPVN